MNVDYVFKKCECLCIITKTCVTFDGKKGDSCPQVLPYYKFMGTLKPSWASCTDSPSLSTIIEE